MDHILTREHDMLRERIRRFVQNEVTKEVAREMDRSREFPAGLLSRLAEEGFTAVNVPKEFGGEGGGEIEVMILCEELSRACPALTWAFGNVILYGNNIIGANGSDEQKQEFLPRLAKGELLFAFALTEPEAGSDAANIKTRAVLDGDHYVINGSKMFITGGTVADYVVTITRTAPHRFKGITSFLVDTKTPGYSTRHIEKLGYRGSDTAEIYYDDVKVPVDMILGGVGALNQGWGQMVRLLNGERLTLSACALGIAEAAMEDVLCIVGRREKAGTPDHALQDVKHRVVEMATELEAARQLACHAAWMEREHLECVKETSMSKYFCTETAKKITIMALEIAGNAGYEMECDLQRYMRDVLILTIGGGTTQIQKNIVAKTLGL